MAERDKLREALNTPTGSGERDALAEKWADHLHHDGTIQPAFTGNCRFGSPLRDDVCHPRRTPSPDTEGGADRG